MYIKLCDRCGRKTKNKTTFLLPCNKEEGHYFYAEQWWGKEISLCNNCLQDFEDFRVSHDHFNKNLTEENGKSILGLEGKYE